MSFKNKYINIICDNSGCVLLNAPYDSPEVDTVLDANRCDCNYEPDCPKCDETGYIGDFHVEWEDESDKQECNVYEYINY